MNNKNKIMKNNKGNNNNKNNKKQKLNTSLTNQDINDHPFRILTHNVQGLNSIAKQEQIIDFMDSFQIDVIGLAETNLSNTPSRYLYKHNDKYVAYFNNRDSQSKGAGV